MPASEVERCLEAVVAALRTLATTSVSDDGATIAQRTDAVQAAGEAFDQALARVSIRYSPVFEWPEADAEWADDEGGDQPALTRLSVDVRADFEVVDETAFLQAAEEMLAQAGAVPLSSASPLVALDALVDTFGLDRLTAGEPVAGLECVGGEWGVSGEEDADLPTGDAGD